MAGKQRIDGVVLWLCLLPFIAGSARGEDLEPWDPLVYTILGTNLGFFGQAVTVLGDVDGDGIKDFAVTSADRESAEEWGRIDLFSGRKGTLIRTWLGVSTYLEASVLSLPDLDADGGPELGLITGGKLHVLSPVTTRTWYTLDLPVPHGGARATATLVPDLDDDGILEFAYGDWLAARGAGLARTGFLGLHSGRTGAAIWQLEGTRDLGLFGNPVIVSGDHDQDGKVDLLTAGALEGSEDVSVSDARSVHVVSSGTGKILRSFHPGSGQGRFGYAMASLGDRDGDGFPTVAISAPDFDKGLFGDRTGGHWGWVGIYHLPGFELERSFRGWDFAHKTFDGDQLGYRLSTAGDADGDGVLDLLMGTTRGDSFRRSTMGRLYLVSGATWEVLVGYEAFQYTFEEPHFGNVLPLDDLDGDGRDEFLVSHSLETFRRPAWEVFLGGAVRVLRYRSDGPRFIRGDTNGDARIDMTDVIRVAEAVFAAPGDPPPECVAAHDLNADGRLDAHDVNHMLGYLFINYLKQPGTNHAPAPPFPACGQFALVDTTPYHTERPVLGCEDGGSCVD
ncbi:MAG TPA: dockerin type I domain-containing protein [Planctomycetota bacterium]|nr:dockerin type I domain-containing protein [Planctomycetota bacterium]